MEKQKASHPQKPHATSQPSRFSHTPRCTTTTSSMDLGNRVHMHGHANKCIDGPSSTDADAFLPRDEQPTPVVPLDLCSPLCMECILVQPIHGTLSWKHT